MTGPLGFARNGCFKLLELFSIDGLADQLLAAIAALIEIADVDGPALQSGKRRLDLEVDEAELLKRRATWKPPAKPARGYARLYAERVTQADKGCDFDFLAG